MTIGTFRPVSETARLSDRVFQQLKEAIAARRYEPGDKLPSENELAEVFQVSRTSVREAMKLLSGQGLVVVKRGLGAYVAEYKDHSQSYIDNLRNVLSREKDNILELFQIRKIMETEAAAWAAQNARPADLEKMERLLAEAEALARDPDCNRQKLNRINTEFHHVLVKAAGNRTLLQVMTGLMDALTEGRDITLQLPGRFLGSVEDHRRILAAVKNGDSVAAKAIMAKHLEAIESTIKNMQ